MSGTAKNPSAAGPIDALVGARIRLRRTFLGLSQEKLGAALGLTFQQVQKYERGANKVGASRLYELSRVLDVPIGFFFDNLAEDGRGSPRLSRRSVGFAEALPDFGKPPCSKDSLLKRDAALRRESAALLQAYSRITDASVRRHLLGLVESMAAGR